MDSDRVITKYPTGYAVNLFDALQAKNAQVNTVVNQGSGLASLLVYMLPLLLLVGLFVSSRGCRPAAKDGLRLR